jgi:DNA-binding transcriptional MerR regulator
MHTDAHSDPLSIGELADAAGLSRRAVRFYVQQKVLPPPLGRGRGRHYDRRHLEQLRRVIELQQHGHSLEAIRQVLAAGSVGGGNGDADPNDLAPDDRDRDLGHPPAAQVPESRPAPPAVLSAELWTRLKITDGVELSFDATRFNPTVEQLLSLRQFIRETLL